MSCGGLIKYRILRNVHSNVRSVFMHFQIVLLKNEDGPKIAGFQAPWMIFSVEYFHLIEVQHILSYFLNVIAYNIQYSFLKQTFDAHHNKQGKK